MIERIANLPEGVTGFRAKGTVTPSDYEKAVLPVLQKLGDGSNILYVAGSEFEGYSGFGKPTPGAAPFSFEKLAFVSEHERYGDAVNAFGWPFAEKARVYSERAVDDAVAWLTEE
jgi:hypothetical protein